MATKGQKNTFTKDQNSSGAGTIDHVVEHIPEWDSQYYIIPNHSYKTNKKQSINMHRLLFSCTAACLYFCIKEYLRSGLLF